LAVFHKSDRRQRITLQVGPERPDAIVVPPSRLNLQLEAQRVAPPALKPGEEAAHTPPTQPVQPESQPAATPAPVNLTQAQPESVRF